jgi:DNA polymerase elongation subunit (family B)
MDMLESKDIHVIYGNTDSCFISGKQSGVSREQFVEAVTEACNEMSECSALSRMSTSFEYHRSALLLTKKKYILYQNDEMTPKGVSIVRRDREKAVSSRIMEVCKIILTTDDLVNAALRVQKLSTKHILELSLGVGKISQCSIIVRRRGIVVYEYMGQDARGSTTIVQIPVDSVSGDMDITYHAGTMVDKYRKGLEAVLISTDISIAMTAVGNIMESIAEDVAMCI